MLENQMRLRKKQLLENKVQKSNEEKEKEINEQINEVLEDMCIYGNVIKNEIKEEKEKNPEKFVEIQTALQSEKTDQGLFALGLIAQNLESIGVEAVIDKEEKEDEQDDGTTCLQFIANGMMGKKKYDLHFEFEEKRNEELLNNEEEYNKFKENLKKKLSKDFNIPPEKIIVTFPQKGSFHVQVIFQSDDFNNLSIDEFKQKFQNDNEFKELSYLKEIHEDVIVGACRLSRKTQLDPLGNRSSGWGENEHRGGKPYNPPLGWIGIGLKVLDKYEDNIWIGKNNTKGEWCVAYHGVAGRQTSDNVKKVTGLIYKGEFKPGSGQVHQNHLDVCHPNKRVGVGVYCTPHISIAESYSGISTINGKNYRTVLMTRVNPTAIRHCSDQPNYWVVNGKTDEIRPYRILYKKC